MNTITKEEMEKAIQQFCIYVQDWIDSGFPKKPDLTTENGLCYNLSSYLRNLDTYEPHRIFRIDTLNYLHTKVFNECNFPFNSDWDEYVIEESKGTHYQNEKRLAFIKEWANKEKL